MARIQELTMARGNRLLLLLALIAGMVAAVLVFVALQQGDSGTTISTGGATASVVVASQDINAGTEITEDMVKIVDLPESLLVNGAVVDTELVVGQTARVKILESEQLAPSKIGVDPESEGLSGVVPIGTRGFSISVDEVTAVGGNLLTGHKVDVYMSIYWDLETPSTLDDIVAQTLLLQDIEVLAVAQQALEAPPVQSRDDAAGAAATSGQLPNDLKEQPDAQTVTLALTPEQVAILVCAQDHDQAKISLALRAFGEPAPESMTVFDPCGGVVR
jgi:Flp pilus assembly protein CpaB